MRYKLIFTCLILSLLFIPNTVSSVIGHYKCTYKEVNNKVEKCLLYSDQELGAANLEPRNRTKCQNLCDSNQNFQSCSFAVVQSLSSEFCPGADWVRGQKNQAESLMGLQAELFQRAEKPPQPSTPPPTVSEQIQDRIGSRGTPPGYEGPIPNCAFSIEGCRDLDQVVGFIINVGKYVLSFLGTAAFVMFIYGGVTMVISFGNADKFAEGKNIMVAAVVGVLIALSAYILVDFVLDSLQVDKNYRAVDSP